MTTSADLSPETAVLDCLERWAAAVRAKDVEAIVAHYTPDIVAFDAILQLQFKGLEAYRRHWDACMALCAGPMAFQIHEEVIHVDGNVAFCHGLIECGGANERGEIDTGWLRATIGLRRIEGEWRIVHEHHSAPFDMTSRQALLDLTP
ncbi:DUF4440 domain-containing protein [Billgrantia azerbaijanica]|nr:DUF4440 domain-containing protein [Halomonas azerbaijanica]